MEHSELEETRKWHSQIPPQHNTRGRRCRYSSTMCASWQTAMILAWSILMTNTAVADVDDSTESDSKIREDQHNSAAVA